MSTQKPATRQESIQIIRRARRRLSDKGKWTRGQEVQLPQEAQDGKTPYHSIQNHASNLQSIDQYPMCLLGAIKYEAWTHNQRSIEAIYMLGGPNTITSYNDNAKTHEKFLEWLDNRIEKLIP